MIDGMTCQELGFEPSELFEFHRESRRDARSSRHNIHAKQGISRS